MLANRIVAPEHYLLIVATREIGRRARAGQFAQIRVPGGAVFLPRPFSFLAAEPDRCSFLSRAIGPGTRALAGLAEGTELDLLGPLGSGFDLVAAASGEVILVGGGVGVPPLVHAAAELAPLTGTALIGAARADFLLCEQEFAGLGWQVQIATDDGSRGHRGFVTDLLEQALATATARNEPPATVLACGPHPMLHRCAEVTAATAVPCQLALEEPMACGFGVCLGCAIRVHTPNPDDPAYALVCRDGPVFPAQRICW
ncbi:MAG: dihydroorotate dehydrogenase electron transfer subunit [Spirochaetaceae bacterium]|nr:dihydroorotate dehydrogenase electron transfer subunit [Spirochaetaceae bacterium]